MADSYPISDQVPAVSAAGQSPQKTVGSKIRRKTAKKKHSTPAASGVPTSGARLQAWLNNPGLRSKLPDSALPAALLEQRRLNQPAAPGSGYTNRSLNALLDTLTRQKYGQAEQQIGQQQQMIPAYFKVYQEQLAGAQAQNQAANQQAVQSLQNMAAAAAGATGQLAGAPTSAEGDARAQAAAAMRSAGIGNQAALAQTLGQNQGNYLQNTVNGLGSQQAAALAQLFQKQNHLALDKGDYRTTQRSQILSDESDQALKNALTSAQIGSTQANAAATVTNAKTSRQRAQESARHNKASEKTAANDPSKQKTQAELDYFKAHGYFPPTGPSKGKGTSGTSGKDAYGNTSKQQAASNDALDKALIYARQAVKDKKHGPDLVGDWKKLANALVVGFNVNPQYARAAAQQVVLGHIGPNTSKVLKRRGVKIPKSTKPVVAAMTDEALSSVGQAVGSIGQ